MPKPCRQPLTPNPFETYRDPLTGRWQIAYPAKSQPADSAAAVTQITETQVGGERKRFSLGEAMPAPQRLHWDSASRTKVA